MKDIKILNRTFTTVLFIMLVVMVLGSCKSTTMIVSQPPDAKLILNNNYVGKTPYKYSDRKVSGSKVNIRIEKEGYEPLHTSFRRNEKLDAGALVGGIFFVYPLLWITKYKPQHLYELTPLPNREQVPTSTKGYFRKTIEALP